MLILSTRKQTKLGGFFSLFDCASKNELKWWWLHLYRRINSTFTATLARYWKCIFFVLNDNFLLLLRHPNHCFLRNDEAVELMAFSYYFLECRRLIYMAGKVWTSCLTKLLFIMQFFYCYLVCKYHLDWICYEIYNRCKNQLLNFRFCLLLNFVPSFILTGFL